MAPPRPVFNLNEPPHPEEDSEGDAATVCEPSLPPHPDADDSDTGDDSTAHGVAPSPPPPEDDSSGDASPGRELLLPVLDLDAPPSPLDDVDEDEDEDVDWCQPHDDLGDRRSSGPSYSSERTASGRSAVYHAKTAPLTVQSYSHATADVVHMVMHGDRPVYASRRHGGRTSPRTSFPDRHDAKTLSQALPPRSSSAISASRVQDRSRRRKPPSVPRDDESTSKHRGGICGEDSALSYGGSHRPGPPSTHRHEHLRRNHPYAMHGQGTPRSNRRRRRPWRQGNNGHGQNHQVNYGEDENQQVNYGHDRRKQVYDQRRYQANNGRVQRRRLLCHGHGRPEGYLAGQHHGYSAPNRQVHQGYSSGRPSASQYYGGEDRYGRQQIPAKQFSDGGYRQHGETALGVQHLPVNPYHPYARDTGAYDDDRTNSGKQTRQQHWCNRQSTGPESVRRHYGDMYN
ncbi:hypothetical protein ABZP36_014309 [Zizania latifolia]